MSRWKQWFKEPKGALPGGIVTKAGIALIGVLVAGMLFSSSLTGPEEDPMAPASREPQPVDERTGRGFDRGLRADTERHEQQAAADDRERSQTEAETDAEGEETGTGAGARGAAGREAGTEGGGSGATGMGQAEYELREALRLEEIERRTRSLRSPPVAGTRRDPNEGRAGAGPATEPDPAEAALDAMLASFGQSVATLEAEMQTGLASEGLLPGAPGAPPQGMRAPGTPEPALGVRLLDPPGWERIREGSFLEAVLLTQLSGEFPGPVLAMVSVPLYSADRQRVLVPRGARVVGTAQAVQNRDQSRLAVAFHRLVLPDSGWIDLEFAGLNQTGEGALRDQVSRHYFSTFAAAGAVGALSGLSLAGASPYGLRAGVGQGLGSSATSVLDRFLNRMPEITIRAGHRLRVWFTGDVLVPTPTAPR